MCEIGDIFIEIFTFACKMCLKVSKHLFLIQNLVIWSIFISPSYDLIFAFYPCAWGQNYILKPQIILFCQKLQRTAHISSASTICLLSRQSEIDWAICNNVFFFCLWLRMRKQQFGGAPIWNYKALLGRMTYPYIMSQWNSKQQQPQISHHSSGWRFDEVNPTQPNSTNHSQTQLN